jgi:hypothetical protein
LKNWFELIWIDHFYSFLIFSSGSKYDWIISDLGIPILYSCPLAVRTAPAEFTKYSPNMPAAGPKTSLTHLQICIVYSLFGHCLSWLMSCLCFW